MKMSLCNTFRFALLSFVVALSSINAPVASFTFHRTTLSIDSSQDLIGADSVIQEIKRDLKGQDVPQVKLDRASNSTNNYESTEATNPPQNFETENNLRNDDLNKEVTTSTEYLEDSTTESSLVINRNLPNLTTNGIYESETTTPTSIYDNEIEFTSETVTRHNENSEDTRTETDLQVNTMPALFNEVVSNKTYNDSSDSISKTKQIFVDSGKNNFKNTKDKIKSRPMPKWKKYTTIERKRPSLFLDERFVEDQKEVIIKAETKQSRITLQDVVTSDIPSLEQLKNDLIASTFQTTPESQNDRDVTATSSPFNFTILDLTTEPTAHVSTVETIRGGFLNLSGQASEVTVEKEISDFKANNNEPLRSMFDTESPEIDILGNKNDKKFDPQSVLNEDALKEELLKEELINDHEENAQRQREDNANSQFYLTNLNVENNTLSNSSLDDNLSVKPISFDKSKNITIYAVNPNYKPMKKIEVLPPKPFVRNPDDNSWRNESLSSLGIVFKPKNSSKPFTQVLKNKTETEWNTLTDRDSKNDLPDLRERLQKMAEKRKSKRKKIDSFGNIVYFDYEENSNSAEQNSVPIDILSSITPSIALAHPAVSSGFTTFEPIDITKLMTSSLTTSHGAKEKSKPTSKSKKLFNVPEYYDTTDEDDSEYLNMAKIDLKKFTTSLRPTTPFRPITNAEKRRDWLTPSQTPSYNSLPERKATVQYFPPLTTQKVNINDYDNDFKMKVESFTTETELPKNVLPMSLDRTTPVVDIGRHKDVKITTNSDFTKDLRLTEPPLSTEPGLRILNDGTFDRGTYIIKHYKDFINEAAKDSEFDKNIDYIPFTEAPVEGVTKTDLTKYEAGKDKANIDTYDYETQFRKGILQRFVDNFNQNSDKYKSNFPIIFNNSVIHRATNDGKDVASSRAFMRGLYNSDTKSKIRTRVRPCEPNCENITVELSPAYELHYYVPDQEEKEEAVPQPATLPYQYRL